MKKLLLSSLLALSAMSAHAAIETKESVAMCKNVEEIAVIVFDVKTLGASEGRITREVVLLGRKHRLKPDLAMQLTYMVGTIYSSATTAHDARRVGSETCDRFRVYS